ncbi:hypothetical protein [Methanosphaera sp. WGK6]|uniref:hypothetical protein n=1 Tax=Methanosphaera sp. WGK6 TaxID=1561964 RepID=UPI00084BF0D3|nr:hypothetical protein [Methanosphaera sp. WGK6]OED29582.1 hypothetical protein NL43_07525 [Methanosphaera sp. WGK6]
MNKEYILLDHLRNEKSIVRAEIMSDEMKKEVIQIEMKHLNDVPPLINVGLDEALKKDETIIVIKDDAISPENKEYKPQKILVNESKKIIGKEVNSENELKLLKKEADIEFISDNFIIYTKLNKPNEKKFFIIPGTSINYITMNLDEYDDDLIVALPSSDNHKLIREWFKIDDNKSYIPYLIGFNR